MAERYRFRAELWEWSARAEWYFVSLPKDVSEEIEDRPKPPRGFGSVPVRVLIGATRWETSIFPNSDGCYSLPIKKSVRKAEGIEPGDRVDVEVELVE